MAVVNIAGRPVGEDNPCAFIAATGSAHNGSLEQAKRLIDAAASATADAIMFQAYTGDIYHDHAPNVRQLVEEGRIEDRPGAFSEYMRGRIMDPSWHPELSRYATEKGIGYLPAVFGDEDLTLLTDLHRRGEVSLAGLGIESMDHSDTAFVEKVGKLAAELDVPVVMSTGMRKTGSVERAVKKLQSAGAQFMLLRSVFGSPSAPDEQGLGGIRKLQGSIDAPVGWSNHTVGHPDADPDTMAQFAIYAGANAMKVQIRLENESDSAPGGPQRALTEGQLQSYIAAAREAELNPRRDDQGLIPPAIRWWYHTEDPGNPLRPSEQGSAALYRTMMPIVDIQPGTPLTVGDEQTPANVTTRRGGVGMHTHEFVEGMTATIPSGLVTP